MTNTPHDGSPDLSMLSTLIGAPVVAAERCGWGFENETLLVTLAHGDHLIVQRLAAGPLAAHKLYLGQVLPPRLAAVGITASRLLATNATANAPYAVREYLPGEPAASRMSTLPGSVLAASAMGTLLPRLAQVSTAGLELSTAWAAPATLAQHAQDMLARCKPLLAASTIAPLVATIAELPGLFAERPAVFAHGDFCPVNALLDGAHVVGLLDLEFARMADALFDAAWWGWVVRYHHAGRWASAWPKLLAAAGIANDTATNLRIASLQRLRCLEMLDYHAHWRSSGRAAMWAERLQTTMQWQH